MGTVVETVSPLSTRDAVHYRQTIEPNVLSGSFTADDTDNHDFKFSSRGKSHLTVAVDNPADQGCTFALYGMHSISDTVGSVGTFPIGAAVTVATASKGYETCADGFPFYLLRVVYAVAPTDVPKKTTTMYADFLGA